MRLDKAQTEKLASYVTEHAQGVFLWVVLVTKSLRDGFIDGDTFDDLQKRLQAMPTELEPFFMQMLKRVDAVHHGYMARMFHMALRAKRPEMLVVYAASEQELRDSNYAMRQQPDWDMGQFYLRRELYKPYELRINARCGGLFIFHKERVEFIHRTVHDFLLTAPMQDYLHNMVVSAFHPNLSLLKAAVFLFRCSVMSCAIGSSTYTRRAIEETWECCRRFANDAIDEDEDMATRLLDAATSAPNDRTLANAARIVQDEICEIFRQSLVINTDAPTGDCLFEMHHVCLIGGFEKYVIIKLKHNPRHFDSPNILLLQTMSDFTKEWTEMQQEILLLLLEGGHNPNISFEALLHPLGDTRPHFEGYSWRGLARVSGAYQDKLLIAYLKCRALRMLRFRNSHKKQADVQRLYNCDRETLHRLLSSYFHTAGPSNITIQSVFEVVDAFLDATSEDATEQAKDIEAFIQFAPEGHSKVLSTSKKLEMAAIYERLARRTTDPTFFDTISPLMNKMRAHESIETVSEDNGATTSLLSKIRLFAVSFLRRG